jgi:tetratricopeptide (TPR) repeat protein
MPDSRSGHIDDQLDRYARGELTAAEARELAQKSLDDTELFEDLTNSAVAKAAVSSQTAWEHFGRAGSGAKIVRFPRKFRVLVAGAAAAAAIILVLLLNRPHSTVPVFMVMPALASSAKPGQPVLLSTDLEARPASPNTAPVFRSPEPDSRFPQATGSVVSIEDGVATINLGSVDGLAKGSELQVLNDQGSIEAAGRLVVTEVFRERARGRLLGVRAIAVNDQVRPLAATYLSALLQRVDALSGQGDSNAARTMMEKAAGWAQSAQVSPGERRGVWERLAALEYQTGSLPAAAEHYRLAAENWNAPPPASAREQATALNNLAALYLLQGQYGGAEAALNQAVSKSLKTDSVYGRNLNNLGVLAELRGDRRKAEAFYTDALRVFGGISDSSEQDRRVAQANLARLRSSH